MDKINIIIGAAATGMQSVVDIATASIDTVIERRAEQRSEQEFQTLIANKRRQRKLLLSDTGLPDTIKWRGIKVIGKSGGGGVNTMWVKLGESKNIIDRMVIKDVRVSGHMWHDDYLWEAPGLKYKRAREAAIHTILSPDSTMRQWKKTWRGNDTEEVDRSASASSEKGDNPTSNEDMVDLSSASPSSGTPQNSLVDGTGIVEIREHIIQPSNLKYRIYMDYLADGNMQDLIEAYKSLSGSKSINEPYLWFVFYSLMMACQAMENIEWPSNGQIVHQNIKLENILLDKASTDKFTQFPIPKLADFDSAHLTTPEDPNNPMGWLHGDSVTEGWLPPEYINTVVHDPPRRPLTSATNIWQAGQVLRALMRLEPSPSFNIYHETTPAMDAAPGLARPYSPALVRWVAACLAADPVQRPRAGEVLRWIGEHVKKCFRGAEAGGGADVGVDAEVDGNADGNADVEGGGEGSGQEGAERFRVFSWNQRDEYAVGMTYKPPLYAEDEDEATGMSDSGELI